MRALHNSLAIAVWDPRKFGILTKETFVSVMLFFAKFWGVFAGVAELVDARDLKSRGAFAPCRFDSGSRHHFFILKKGLLSMKKYRWTIVGCGRIYKKHLEALKKHSDKYEIIGVCDIKEDRLQKAMEDTGANGYKDIKEMLKTESPDGISICTPSGLHTNHIRTAADFNVNVITEKPFALSSEDAQRTLDYCNDKGIKLWVVKQNRLNPAIKLLKSAIDKNRFGKIYYIEINVFWNRTQEYFDMDEWRGTVKMDGGILFNQASHYVDLMEYIGGGVKSVAAFTKRLARNIEFEDTITASVEYKNGALGSLNVTVLTYRHNMEGSITVIGEKGTVKIGGMALNKVDYWEFDKYDDDDAEIEYVSTNPPNVYGFGHMELYEKIYNSLVNEKKSCMFDANEMIHSLKIKEAVYKSAKEGIVVYL